MSSQTRNPNGDPSYIWLQLLSCDPQTSSHGKTQCVKCRESHDGNTPTQNASACTWGKNLITSFCFSTGAKTPPVSKAPGHLFPGFSHLAHEALEAERLWQLPWGTAAVLCQAHGEKGVRMGKVAKQSHRCAHTASSKRGDGISEGQSGQEGWGCAASKDFLAGVRNLMVEVSPHEGQWGPPVGNNSLMSPAGPWAGHRCANTHQGKGSGKAGPFTDHPRPGFKNLPCPDLRH